MQAARDQEAWDALMGAFGDDPGETYEKVRGRLESFFSWKGCVHSEELADETLMRMGRKLAEGETLEKEPARYALGVARFVYLETVKREVRQREAELEASDAAFDEDAEVEIRLRALDDCMKALGEVDAGVVRRYYEEPKGHIKITKRKALADDLGVTPNALRIRTLRLRQALADCVEKKLGNVSDLGATHG